MILRVYISFEEIQKNIDSPNFRNFNFYPFNKCPETEKRTFLVKH